MIEPSQLLLDTSPATEIMDAPLGDSRRNDRFEEIVQSLTSQPDASVPEAMGTQAALEAYYRFMRNEAIDHQSLLEPHFDQTRQRAESLSRALVVHDTTEFNFTVHDKPSRENLACPKEGRQSFLWHPSLVLSADGKRAPLGLIASRPFVHAKELPDEQAHQFWDERGGIYENEMWRWMEGVEAAESRLSEVMRPVHIMDSECDDYGLMYRMSTSDYPFIIRMCYERNISDGPLRDDYRKISDALDEEDWCADEREVFLSARPERKTLTSNYLPRRARKVRMRVRSTTVELRRPKTVLTRYASNTLEVRVVEVTEVDPPEGEEPVRWVLATSELVDEADQIWEVVDHYRARWVIEEYFKALKTGTGYSNLQHKRAKTLLSALSTKAVVAWNLLRLRHLGRHVPDLDAQEVLNDVQMAILQEKRPNLMPDDATAEDAMKAVAGLGGHIPQNGPAGWQVLGRGWEHMAELEEGVRIAQSIAD